MRVDFIKIIAPLVLLSTCTEELLYSPPPQATNITVKGDMAVGSMLTGTYDFSGGSGVQGKSTYQWLVSAGNQGRGVQRIAGATQQTYTPTLDDEGKFIAFEVTPIDDKNDTGKVVYSTFEIVKQPPTPMALNVMLTGNLAALQVLTGVYNFTGGTGRQGTSRYRWLVADSEEGPARPIAGATRTTYTTTPEDAGKFIAFEVVPVDDAGGLGEPVRSGFRHLLSAYPSVSEVKIIGKSVIGQVINGQYTFTRHSADREKIGFRYRWLSYPKNINDEESLRPIQGATGKTYTLRDQDEGWFIVFEVTPVDSSGFFIGKPVRSVSKRVVSQAIYNTYFITTWRVAEGSLSITIPTNSEGNTYNYDVDWNADGFFEQKNILGNATHVFPKAGDYTVAIRGIFPQIYFNGTGDKDKIISIDQWGTNAWRSMKAAFKGCTNLHVNASDNPNLFTYSTSMESMFAGATAFNEDIGDWNVILVMNMRSLFQNASRFNQDLSRWDTKNVGDMSGMFERATSFDQNIGGWNVSKVGNMSNMFKGITLSTDNYSALLIAWTTQTLKTNVTFHGGNSTYSAVASDAHNRLFGAGDYGWILQQDGGQAP